MVESAQDKVPGSKKALLVVWLTVFIDLIGFSIIFPLFPAMLNWYLPREQEGSLLASLIDWLKTITPADNSTFLVAVLFGGILGSLYSLVQFFSSPFWGKWSDKLGRRNILLYTTSGTALSYLLWIFAGDFSVLILARAVGGFMAGNIAVATAAIADITTRENRSKGMALIGVAFGLGFIFGPAIGGIGSLWEWVPPTHDPGFFGLNPFSAPAFFALLLALLNIFVVYKFFPETKIKERAQPAGIRRIANIWRSPNPKVRKALRIYFVFIFAFSGMEFTLTFLALERLAYQPEDMTKMFVFIGLVLILSQGYLVRKYAHKVGERNFVTIGLLSGFIGLLLLSRSVNATDFYLGLAALGIGIGCSSPSLTSLVSLYTTDQEQGEELGRFRSMGSLARAVGPLLGAILFWYASSAPAYLVGAALLGFTAIFSVFLPKPESYPET